MNDQPRLHAIKEGSGPIVVLSHALGCDLAMWDGVAARLKERYTVVRYDHRGHGLSDAPRERYTMGMLADDAANLIRDHAGEPVHFVGLSMGGMTAQALAAQYPELVKSIVVANAACHYDGAARGAWQARIETVKASGMQAIADGAMQRWFTPAFRASAQGAPLVERSRQQLLATDATAYAASCDAVSHIDLAPGNASIKCPALVIAGTLDEATPLSSSEAIARSIPGSVLQTLEAAHLSAVEQPDAFAELVSAFIKGNLA